MVYVSPLSHTYLKGSFIVVWRILWTMLCCVLALRLPWVVQRRNTTPHPLLQWRTHRSTIAKCRPRLSPRPKGPPGLQMHLFGQDWLLVCWTHPWCRCEQLASPGPQHCPLRPGSSQSPLQSPLRPGSSQSPLQSPLRPGSSQSPLQSPLRPGSSQSPLQSPLRPGSSQSPLQRPLRPGSSQSPLQRPLRPGSSQSPLQRPLRPGSSQSPLQRPAPSRELAESAPEAAPSRELAESAPEAAPSRELAESAPEAASSRELAESAPEAAPSRELAESAPESLLVPSGSRPSMLVPSSLALCERPRDPAPPECPLEVVEFLKNFLGRIFPPLLTETPNPPWPMESPDSSWLPEAPDLLWPPRELTTSILETICALSVSCVSVSSRSQSLPWVSSATPWRAPVSSALPWRAPVSSAPPWWASVSSALPWWASVSSAPPWWASVSPAPPREGVCLVCSALVDVCLVCFALVDVCLVGPALMGVCLVCSALVGVCLVCSALVGVCLIGSSWTWPSVPCHGSTSAPPPSWMMLCMWSVWKPLLGGGSVTNLVASHHSTTAHHQWTTTPIMHCTTTHTFPSTIAPITQLSPITINPDCLTTPAPHSHTHSYMHSLRSLVLPWLTFPSVFPSVSICVLPGLLTLSPDRLLPASLTTPAYWLSSLSAACPDPLLCLWLRICLVYIALDTSVWYLPVWPPLCINKAADGSQRHWPVITN